MYSAECSPVVTAATDKSENVKVDIVPHFQCHRLIVAEDLYSPGSY